MRYALPFLLLLICFRLEAQLIPSSFRSPVTFAIPDQSSNDERDRLEVADLDGDDMMDIIATDISRGDMYIYRNAYTSGTLTNSSFDPRLDFEFWPSVLGVSGTAVADIDGDGKTDILFSNSTTPCNTNGFGVVRNNATPGSLSALDFEAPVFFQTGGCQSDITVADVDGDGKMDAIVVAPFSVFVLRNTSTPGNISFAAPVSSATRMEGRARLHMADVDTDGKPDILVGYSTDLGNDEISVFLNTSNVGAVSLAARQDFFIGTAARPWHIKSHDFDGDTKEEIIVATQFGGLAVLKNTSTPGTINLAIQAGFEDIGELSAPLSDVRLADFDQDGFIDIAGSEPSRAHVGVVRTISTTIDSAMFDTPVTFGAPNGTTGGFADTKVADFNGDGLPDIVSMRRNQVAVYENQFRRPPIISSISAYEGAVGDVITIRGSGFDPTHTNNIVLFGQVKAQTVSSTGSTIDVEVPLGAALDEVSVSTDGLTTISSRKFVPLFDGGTIDASSFAGAEVFSTTGFFRNTLELSDLDLDGKPDITISTGNIEFFKNTSTPGTIDQNTLTTQPTIFLGVSSVNTIGLGDLTGDGKADIFRNGSSSPGLFQNLSSGIDPTPFSFGGSIPSGTNGVVLGLPAGDLNLDGKVDLMFVSGSVALVQNFQRADTLGTQNIPDFAISPNAVTLLSPITLTLGGSFATDLDGDGKTDVGVISQSENLIRIFRNTLDPGQRTGWLEKFVGFDLPADGSSIAIETIDLDGDGDQEIASTSMATDQISIYPNQSNAGTLSFGTKFTLSTLADPTQIESADLNGDGLPELVVVYNTVQQISVFPNLGTLPLSSASFGTRIDYTLPGAARDLDIGDIDLDGKPDIVIGLLNQSNIAILKNQTSTAVRITIDQQPVAQSACTGEDAIFSIQASGTTNLLYQWQVDDGSGFVNLTDNAIYSGTQTNELTVTNVTLSLDDNLYRCVVTGDNAVAVNTNSAILNVNTVATPTITANGPLTFCEGGSVMLSGPAGFAQYLWSTGATTQNITVSTTQSVMLQVGDGRCLSASSPAVQVTVNDVPDQPTITVNGDTEICEGDQTQLSGPSGFDIYQWSNGATTQNITITSTATLTLVVGNQGCLSPASAPVAITVNAIPATPEIRASGPIGFCQGESVTLSGPNGFSTYQWSNGETTQNITVSSTFTVTLIVGNAGCLSAPSDAVNVTVSEIPQQPQITVNGETTICEGEQTVLSGPGGFDVYQWSNGETTQNVTITASQTLTLVVGNAGCLSVASEAVTITVIDAPDIPEIIVTGSTALCEGETITLIGPAGFSVYQWSNGASTQSIELASSANITLQVGNGGCLSPSSDPVVITVDAVPDPPQITLSGPADLCDGDLVTLSGPDGFDQYSWSNGAVTQSIEVNAPETFTLTVANGTCLSGPSQPITITVSPAPAVPEITVQGNFLVASEGASRYQWYDEGESIAGATTRYLELNLLAFGNYTVEAWIGSCSETSLPFTFIVTSLDDLVDGERPVIFPVPFEHQLSIANLDQWQGANITLYGLNGDKHFQTQLNELPSGRLTIETQHLRSGTYLIILQEKNHIYWQRIVKH